MGINRKYKELDPYPKEIWGVTEIPCFLKQVKKLKPEGAMWNEVYLPTLTQDDWNGLRFRRKLREQGTYSGKSSRKATAHL